MKKDGEWVCTNPTIASILNNKYSPQEDYSPSQGAYGFAQLHAAAAAFNAKIVDLVQPKPGKPGTVY